MSCRLAVALGITALLSACATERITPERIRFAPTLAAELGVPVELSGGIFVSKRIERSDTGSEFARAVDLVFGRYLTGASRFERSASYQALFVPRLELRVNPLPSLATAVVSLQAFDMDGALLWSGKAETTVDSNLITPTGSNTHNALVATLRQVLEDALRSIGRTGLETLRIQPARSLTNASADELQRALELVSTGTGLFINDAGQVLTAAHVVNGCMLVRVQHDEEKLPAVTLTADRIVDLALLDTGLTGTASPPLASTSEIKLGQDIIVLGFPLSNIFSSEPSLTQGSITSLAGTRGNRLNVQVSAPVQPGNSGAPVINRSGVLTGVVVGSLNSSFIEQQMGNAPQNVNFVVRDRVISRFMDRAGAALARVEPRVHRAGPDMDSLIDSMREYTVQVACYE